MDMSKKFTLRFKGQKPFGFNDDISYAKECDGFVFGDGSLKSDVGFAAAMRRGGIYVDVAQKVEQPRMVCRWFKSSHRQISLLQKLRS